jgi:hypothetical protein
VAGFVGLDCSTISIIANRTAEAKKKPRMKTPMPIKRIGEEENARNKV